MGTFLTTSLKKGDRVGVQHCSNWEPRYTIQIVKSVSKTGQVTLENGDRFTSNGSLMGGSRWHGTYLKDVTEVETILESRKVQQEHDNKVSRIENEFNELLRNKKNGFRQYGQFSPEDKQKLVDLINNL